VTEDYWDERLNTNLQASVLRAQAVIPGMKRASGGVILNFGSISWHLALGELTLYQTAKAAIEGLTRSFARELGRTISARSASSPATSRRRAR
jgi:NAD(P)-dependent dehydrogenase (short-subunit alcohol dehydrogenase family)